jgi:hypothetical protein
MAMISYKMYGVERSYTPVALDKLDVVRLELRAKLAELKATTGDEFILRTFYLGPRKYYNHNTLKTDARCAKIGVYKVQKRGKYVYPNGEFSRYVNSELKYYV